MKDIASYRMIDLNDCGKSQKWYWQTALFWHEKNVCLIACRKNYIINWHLLYKTIWQTNRTYFVFKLMNHCYCLEWNGNGLFVRNQKYWQINTKRCQKICHNFVNHFRLMNNKYVGPKLAGKVFIWIIQQQSQTTLFRNAYDVRHTTIQPFHLSVGFRKCTQFTVCMFGALTDFPK